MITNRLAPAKAYIDAQRKARLDNLVQATSHRMTISKLIDECAEVALPVLEQKYLGGLSPVQRMTHRRRKMV